VFRTAQPIVGGREFNAANGPLEERATPSDVNNFQGRYVVRHRWTGAIACESPIRNRWGGPPAGTEIADGGAPQAATNIAFAPRGKVDLPNLVAQDVPEIAVKQGQPLPGGAGFHGKSQGCACDSRDAASTAGGGMLAFLTIVLMRRRRR
jgi:MYXO-CTERM domain-containing protein